MNQSSFKSLFVYLFAGPARSEVQVTTTDFYPKPPPMTTYPGVSAPDYQKSAPVTVGDNRFNSNIMIVDSRCSSLESPVTGIRPSDMVKFKSGFTKAKKQKSYNLQN